MSRIVEGASVRDTLSKLATGPFPNVEAVAQLDAEPALPRHTADVWAIYLDLHIRRDRDENGPRLITWNDLKSYSGVTGARLSQWQLSTIFALENAYFAVEAENKA